MANRDLFHEAKMALGTAKREMTSVNSLNAVSAFATTQACEQAMNGLWNTATGNDFPYRDFPRHKVGRWIEQLGIKDRYSPRTQAFLDKLDAYCLDKARYEGTIPYEQHILEASRGRGKELVKGTGCFIAETQELAADPGVLAILRSYKPRHGK